MPVGRALDRDPRLADVRDAGGVEVEHRRPATTSSAPPAAVNASGSNPVEIGEAPVLVGLRRQRERLVALQRLRPRHGRPGAARSGGAASGRSRRGRRRTPCGRRRCRTSRRRTRCPSPRAPARGRATSSTCSARCAFFCGANSSPNCVGSQIPKHVSPTQNSNRAVLVGAEAERLDVEAPRALPVLRRDRDEVDLRDVHRGHLSPTRSASQPSLPSAAGSAGSSRRRTRAAAPS